MLKVGGVKRYITNKHFSHFKLVFPIVVAMMTYLLGNTIHMAYFIFRYNFEEIPTTNVVL